MVGLWLADLCSYVIESPLEPPTVGIGLSVHVLMWWIAIQAANGRVESLNCCSVTMMQTIIVILHVNCNSPKQWDACRDLLCNLPLPQSLVCRSSISLLLTWRLSVRTCPTICMLPVVHHLWLSWYWSYGRYRGPTVTSIVLLSVLPSIILPADQLQGDALDLTQLRNLDFVSDIIRTHVALWFCHLPTS